jgi:hypothetical protein
MLVFFVLFYCQYIPGFHSCFTFFFFLSFFLSSFFSPFLFMLFKVNHFIIIILVKSVVGSLARTPPIAINLHKQPHPSPERQQHWQHSWRWRWRAEISRQPFCTPLPPRPPFPSSACSPHHLSHFSRHKCTCGNHGIHRKSSEHGSNIDDDNDNGSEPGDEGSDVDDDGSGGGDRVVG